MVLGDRGILARRAERLDVKILPGALRVPG